MLPHASKTITYHRWDFIMRAGLPDGMREAKRD